MRYCSCCNCYWNYACKRIGSKDTKSPPVYDLLWCLEENEKKDNVVGISHFKKYIYIFFFLEKLAYSYGNQTRSLQWHGLEFYVLNFKHQDFIQVTSQSCDISCKISWKQLLLVLRICVCVSWEENIVLECMMNTLCDYFYSRKVY